MSFDDAPFSDRHIIEGNLEPLSLDIFRRLTPRARGMLMRTHYRCINGHHPVSALIAVASSLQLSNNPLPRPIT